MTFAYTYHRRRRQNRRYTRSTTRSIEETIRQYPFINSNAAPRHRIVSTGSIRAPWGFVVAGEVDAGDTHSGRRFGLYGLIYPNGSGCTPISVTPKNFFGYRALDLQVTKNFDIASYASVYVRFDGLNVFNLHNYSDTLLSFGGNGVANPNPVSYNYIGNINGVRDRTCSQILTVAGEVLRCECLMTDRHIATSSSSAAARRAGWPPPPSPRCWDTDIRSAWLNPKRSAPSGSVRPRFPISSCSTSP